MLFRFATPVIGIASLGTISEVYCDSDSKDISYADFVVIGGGVAGKTAIKTLIDHPSSKGTSITAIDPYFNAEMKDMQFKDLKLKYSLIETVPLYLLPKVS